MKIHTLSFHSSVLRKKAEEVSVEEEIFSLVKKMKKVLREADGVGIAAPQIGESKRVVIVSTPEGNLVLINPKIIKKSKEKISSKEGCLSVPGVWLNILRFRKVKVKALNLKGEEIEIEAKDIMAIILQHEIDHLDGILFIDHAPFLLRTKILLNYYLQKIKK